MFWFVHPCDYSELSTNFHEILDSGIKLDFGDDLDAFSNSFLFHLVQR